MKSRLRLTMIDERVEDEPLELMMVPQEDPPVHDYPMEIFHSDSSVVSERGDSLAEPLTLAERPSSAETPPLTLAQQLRAAAKQAAQLEALFVKCKSKMTNVELSIWTTNHEKNLLSNKLTELQWEMGLQTFDLLLYKELVQFQETSRKSLSEQLTHTTSELLQTLTRLNLAQNTVNELQAQVIQLQSELAPWN